MLLKLGCSVLGGQGIPRTRSRASSGNLGRRAGTGAQQEKQRALRPLPSSTAAAFRAAHDRVPVGRTNEPFPPAAPPPLQHDVKRHEAVFANSTSHAANLFNKPS